MQYGKEQRGHASFSRTVLQIETPAVPPGTAFATSPADFARLIAQDTEKWGRVVKLAGIRAG